MSRLLVAFLFILSAIPAVAQVPPYPIKLTVAADGSGDYKKIQDAINAVRAYCPEHITITIKKGVYKEKVIIPSWVTNMTIIGESRSETIITYDDYSGKYMFADTTVNNKKFSTFNSYTMWVQGNDISIQNLTIQNTAGRVGQAVALHVDGDRFEIKDCDLLGNQDTLLTAGDSTRQYYFNCLITGTTDFIFGPATAVFDRCVIRSLTNSYITAASTPQWKQYGYVFLDCKIEAAPEATSVYLGRPWRAYARTVFIRNEMGKHIRAEGWHNWSKVENEKTAFYAEYKNTGEGSITDKRVSWSKQLSDKEAKQYTLQNIFTNWQPSFAKK